MRAGVAGLALIAAGCGPAPAVVAVVNEAARPAVGVDAFHYEVRAGAGARELAVELIVPAGGARALTVSEAAAPFVRAVRGEGGAIAAEASEEGAPSWRLPPCPAAGCRVRYTVALGEAARAVGDDLVAAEHAGAIVAPPSSWLLHSPDPPEHLGFTLRVVAPPEAPFASGLFPAPGLPDTYAATVADLPKAPFSVFGARRAPAIALPGMRVEAAILPGPLAASDAAIARWIDGAARVVHAFHGGAPVPRLLVIVAPAERPARGVGYARVLGNGGAAILAPVGRQSDEADLTGGWQLIHELIHVAFPSMAMEHHWLTEGIATYFEPLLRARRGQVAPEAVFARFVARMPFGLPKEGDQGLDRTPTWGRLYWGGALFCLLADVEIRARTGGRRSLDDALRAITRAGGNVAARWSMAQVIAVGDAAVGVPVLAELYARYGNRPAAVDLPALWRRLGVIAAPGGVRFDESAELAGIRRALTRGA